MSGIDRLAEKVSDWIARHFDAILLLILAIGIAAIIAAFVSAVVAS